VENCWHLIPPVHKTTILDRYGLSNLGSIPSKPPASNSVGDIPLPISAPSCVASQDSPGARFVSPNTTASSTESTPGSLFFTAESQSIVGASLFDSEIRVARHFKNIAPGAHPDRIQRLVRVVRGFVEAKALPQESYEMLWSFKDGIFEGSEDGLERFCRLQRGRRKIMVRTTEYDCATRLALLFVNHDIDHLSKVPKKSKDPKLRRGQNRKTAAFQQLVAVSDTPLEVLKTDWKNSRNYSHVLAQAGPGSLLEMGSGVNSV
jgi:hypothetical protein